MRANHTSLRSPGQFHGHLQMMKVATSTIPPMEYAFKEVLIQLLHGIQCIGMERVYKIIHRQLQSYLP
jgi:hypothetical protein